MSNSVYLGKRQIGLERICEHLSRSHLLPQVLREMIIDRVLMQWEPASAGELSSGQAAFDRCHQEITEMAIDRQLDRTQLIKAAVRKEKLQQFKRHSWEHKLGSYYLERKVQLDRVIYSIIQVEDVALAQELFFRIQSRERSFGELALRYSQGAAAIDGGRVGPISMSNLPPDIASQVTQIGLGELSPLLTIGDTYAFIRLEELIPAQFDDRLKQFLLDELFEKWLQAQIASEIGLISMESESIPPRFYEQ